MVSNNLWARSAAMAILSFATATALENVASANPMFGWVVNDEPKKDGPHEPALQYNSAKAKNSIVRTRAGKYTVTFSKLAGIHAGNVQVTALGEEATHCKVASWSKRHNDVEVNVICLAGPIPHSNGFVVSYQEMAAPSERGHAAHFQPDERGNALAQEDQIATYGIFKVGTMMIAPPYQAEGLLGLAASHATAVGASTYHCMFTQFDELPGANGPMDGGTGIRCGDTTTAASYSPFFFVRGLGNVPAGSLRGVFVVYKPFGRNPGSPGIQRTDLRGEASRVQKRGTGRYTVQFEDKSGMALGASMVHVTAVHFQQLVLCSVVDWISQTRSPQSKRDVSVEVACFSLATTTPGEPTDSGFTMTYIRSDFVMAPPPEKEPIYQVSPPNL